MPSVRTERARVLVTVKASPVPSEKYGDTVCVAGIRLDTAEPTWIRLYPIDFRYLTDDAQFQKYDVIELEVQRRASDSRPESYTPIRDSWRTVDHFEPWQRRIDVIQKLPTTSMCALRRAAQSNASATSLAIVHPRKVVGLHFEPRGEWTADELAKMQARIRKEEAALIRSGPIPTIPRAPRFKVRYEYYCDTHDCGGHKAMILDWELTSLQNRYLRASDARVREVVEDKYHRMMFDPKRHSGFFMGNFERAAYRQNFAVLGVYYPELNEVYRSEALDFTL